MESPKMIPRFSSCRGVSFEMQSYEDLFDFSGEIAKSEDLQPSRTWFRMGNKPASLFKVFPYSNSVFMSPASSTHFCDLGDEKDDDDDDLDMMVYDIENQKQVLASSINKATKKQSRLSILLLDQGLFTVYKRLFVFCIALNMTFLILAITGHFHYAKDRATLFSIANILALTMCRSEAFLRVVFWLAVELLGHTWVPLGIKTCTTSFLQCLGGVHSGCGVSSIVWLVYALARTLNDRDHTSPEIIGVAIAILGLICLSSLAAFPVVRHLHHNVFERTHRFAGWSALLLLWAFTTLTISYDPKTKSYSKNLWGKLVKQQEFWFTAIITVLIILPWVTLRRVPVKVSAPSGHASIIKFEGGIQPGILGRISLSPFSEWHAFGIISKGNDEHMMLAGAVGDFTKSLVSNPPSHLWVRTVRFAGLPYLVNLYDKVVLVATGSGICVFLSFLLQPCKADVCLVWVAKGIEQNYGKEIKEMINGYNKKKVIVHDTSVLGRPDVAKMSVEAAKTWGAQVVIVTSNPEGSRDVVNACKSAGIAAFGPIWDS